MARKPPTDRPGKTDLTREKPRMDGRSDGTRRKPREAEPALPELVAIRHPFSRPFDVSQVKDGPVSMAIEASAAERTAIVEEDGLMGLDALAADLKITPAGQGRVHVSGKVRARVTQECVVTLEPFVSDVESEIDVMFAPLSVVVEDEKRALAQLRAGVPAEEAVEPADPIIDGRIDLGGVATEFMVLGLDPYPRKPGIAFEAPAEDKTGDSPFAVLKGLTKKD